MSVKFLNGFSAMLTADLSATAVSLPITAAMKSQLCSRLGAGNSSFLVLTNGVGYEIVGVSCVAGQPLLDRGSPAITVAKGNCVRFEVTEELLSAYQAQGGGGEVICKVLPGDGIEVETNGCEVTISAVVCDEVTWSSGNLLYTFKDGCISTSPLTGCTLAPGTYENATIVVNSEGKICSVSGGANIVFNQNCGCN